MTTNAITLAVLLAPWALFLVWEIYVLVRRGQDKRVKTISMVARDYGHRLSSLVYAWGFMAAHWWWPSTFYAAPWASVLGWVVLVLLLIQDVFCWSHPRAEWPVWLKVQRHPVVILVAGLLAGVFLFPQMGVPW